MGLLILALEVAQQRQLLNMAHRYYFNNDGEPVTGLSVSGDELVAKGIAIMADVPDGIETWRLSYNTATKAVVVRYEGLSEEDAVAKQLSDGKAESEAEALAEKERQDALSK